MNPSLGRCEMRMAICLQKADAIARSQIKIIWGYIPLIGEFVYTALFFISISPTKSSSPGQLTPHCRVCLTTSLKAFCTVLYRKRELARSRCWIQYHRAEYPAYGPLPSVRSIQSKVCARIPIYIAFLAYPRHRRSFSPAGSTSPSRPPNEFRPTAPPLPRNRGVCLY